ncbi:hypothetical protein GCM10009547_43360 [Sporichthya brevicatena]|uniref:Uncharacterized protein n=1 Tax=Sporichthya brevicatena TaxID=171442 RepID=A0ABN1HAR7_9ACTN
MRSSAIVTLIIGMRAVSRAGAAPAGTAATSTAQVAVAHVKRNRWNIADPT